MSTQTSPPTSPQKKMLGPYTRPLHRDPAAWVTAAVVVATTLANAARAWSESASISNALVVGSYTLVLSAVTTLFVVSVLVGVPRGWRLGRDGG